MALSPAKAVTFGLLWDFWVSLLTEVKVNQQEIPPCDGWDILTGCDDTRSQIFARVTLGTIPGAPDEANVAFAIFGLVSRLIIIWGLLELARGS